MLFEVDKKLQIVIILFTLTIIILYQQKHKSMFTEEGGIKPFGTGQEKTITPLWLVSLAIGLLIYVYFTVKEDDFV
jgi:hypothetical protein|tara:strand:+ start:6624 stop:6851 length:228 start_codon:yes stop_codon:yes gene_type:complete